MESIIRRVLFTKDWGIPKDELSEEEAAGQGMALVENRWVDKFEERQIKDVLKAAWKMRVAGGLGIMWFAVLVPSIPYLIAAHSYPPPAPTPGVFAFLLAITMGGAYLLWQIGMSTIAVRRTGHVFTIVSNLAALLFFYGQLAYSVWMQERELTLILLPFCVAAASGLLLSTNPTVMRLAQVCEKVSSEDGKPEIRVLTFWRLVGFCALLSITVSAGMWYFMSYSRIQCDRAASGDTAMASACLERLGNELVDMGFTFDEATGDTLVAVNVLRYMVGPYYGWRGGTRKCEVVFRWAKAAFRWEIQGASLRGSQPAGQGSRYVYGPPEMGGGRAAAIMTGIADARNGTSQDWNSYPYRESPDDPELCYTESMVDPEKKPPSGQTFVFRVPKSVPCDQLRGLD